MLKSWDDLQKEFDAEFLGHVRTAQWAGGWAASGPSDDSWDHISGKMEDLISERVSELSDAGLHNIVATAPEGYNLTDFNENGEGDWGITDHIEHNIRDFFEARYNKIINQVDSIGFVEALKAQGLSAPLKS